MAHRTSKCIKKNDATITIGSKSNKIIILCQRYLLSKRYPYILLDKTLRILIEKRIKQILAFCFMLMITHNLAHANKRSLQNLLIENANRNLIVSFRLENAFSSQMKEFISIGTPITFTYLVALYEIRDFWIDKKIVNSKIDYMMKYDIFKKEFVIKKSWQIDEVLITGSFDEAQILMTKKSGLKIFPFNWFNTDNRYQIGIKAEHSKANLPVNFDQRCFSLFLGDLKQIGI